MNRLYDIIKDPKRVILENIEEKYLTDTLGRVAGTAQALVFPKTTDEVSKIMKYAYENDIPVTPRGAGTNLVGSTVPLEGGIVLDVSQMDQILEIDKETFTATVEPGVVLKDFQAAVEKEGLFYPPDPGEKTATIGGNISTNAGGMRAVKYGVTRDYVRSLEIVLPDGQVMTAGTKTVKDSSGLPLKHLIIGSEGTLGIITKAVVKLIVKPQISIGVLLPFADLKTGIHAVLNVIRGNVDPTAIEFVEKKVIALGEEYTGLSFPYPKAKAYIILTLDGDDKGEILKRIDKIRDIAKNNGALDTLVLEDPRIQDTVWQIRGCLVKAVEAKSEQIPVDIVVPIDKSAEFIDYVNHLEEQTGVTMVSFGHAGDGNVHLCVVRGNRNDEEWEQISSKVMEKIYDKSHELGGLTSGEHGIGISKKTYFLKATPSVNLQIMKQIKSAIDPKNLLNPKKVFQ
ncbi:MULTISPECIES: FAD-binding oxidoreductase [Anaerostipes]|uniref:FAD-binding oxidoreductase n=1 Tax=Anaerostipes TaxID=207244 RepID=UPI000A9D3C6A|nr:FAD-binding oxidoreductase [Anaerostipes sp. 494a]MDY2725706.1 FAD-binding oxidoreductase [Anaerostipes faecalis]